MLSLLKAMLSNSLRHVKMFRAVASPSRGGRGRGGLGGGLRGGWAISEGMQRDSFSGSGASTVVEEACMIAVLSGGCGVC